MVYRADLERRRAEVRRLEVELAEAQQEIALLRSLPTSRGLEHRVLGAQSTLKRQVILDETLDVDEHEAIITALDTAYGTRGCARRTARGIVWRARPEPRGRHVEVFVEEDGAARTSVRVSDVHGRARMFFLSALGVIGGALPFVWMTLELSWWMLVGLAAILVGPALQALAAWVDNRCVGARRERQAIAAESAIAAALAESSSARVRIETATEPDEDEAAAETPRAAARSEVG